MLFIRRKSSIAVEEMPSIGKKITNIGFFLPGSRARMASHWKRRSGAPFWRRWATSVFFAGLSDWDRQKTLETVYFRKPLLMNRYSIYQYVPFNFPRFTGG